MTLCNALQGMITGDELFSALAHYPEYDAEIRHAPAVDRLIALNNLYEVYYPFPMSAEIYSKMYLALLRSFQKKHSKIAVQQINENRKAILGVSSKGVIGGSDSFTILGCSGIGKSTAIARAIALMHGDEILTLQSPYCKLIPVLVVQCPFDSSVKGLLLEILRKVDEALESKYYANALRAHATTDMLIGSVSTACLNHLALLIIDEVQNVANSKNGKGLIGALTQLINNSGISIAMVGTPEAAPFFAQDYKLARRSLGLQYDTIPFDTNFVAFCQTLWHYQYIANASPLSDGIIHWLYEHSNGITSNVVSLVHDAQEIAILDGSEALVLESLNKAYTQRMGLLHQYMENPVLTTPARARETVDIPAITNTHVSDAVETELFAKAAVQAKKQGCSPLNFLAGKISITEVKVS